MHRDIILIRNLGLQPYIPVLCAMHNFTNQRHYTTPDEIWMVEHMPVFTHGKSSKDKNLVVSNNIPVVYSDRGGKITYHGPGQQIMYVLINLKRRKLNIKKLVTILEQTVINTLEEFGIYAYTCINAPGVYINKMKICSLGLRINKGCSLHGLALNINMDLSPFLDINPCGYSEIKMIQMCQYVKDITLDIVNPSLISNFMALLCNILNVSIDHKIVKK